MPQHLGYTGARLLASDMRVAFILANEARYRSFEWLLGVPRDQANLITAALLLTAADATHTQIRKLAAGPAFPSAADSAVGVAFSRGIAQRIAGPEASQVPLFGSLVLLAIVGGAARPAVEALAHGARSASRELRQSFIRRYGHSIRSARRAWSARADRTPGRPSMPRSA